LALNGYQQESLKMLKIIDHSEIREIRLARLPVNALNLEFVQSLTKSLREAENDCNAVVLSGQERVFSAGLDIVDLIRTDHEGMTIFWRSFFELLETIACFKVPVAAAVTGHSPAGGAVIGMMCDYRVMSSGKFRIGLNETRVGLIIPWVLHKAMQRLVGPGVAEQMVVAGTMIEPEKALEIGLVDAVVKGYEETIQHAIQWCVDLLALPRQSMLGNRAIARSHFRQEFATNTDQSVASFVETWFSDETQSLLHDLVFQLKGRK
jgi:enoyl-CoA hydratase/carnithine racemase